MMHHHPGWFGKTIDFGDGFSQGYPSGSMACALSIQFVAYLTALKQPSEKVELLAFQDDCKKKERNVLCLIGGEPVPTLGKQQLLLGPAIAGSHWGIPCLA